jgi:hypothetical protein
MREPAAPPNVYQGRKLFHGEAVDADLGPVLRNYSTHWSISLACAPLMSIMVFPLRLRASELAADANDGAAQYLAGDQLGAHRWYFVQRHGASGYLP